jgi:CTP synthase
VEVVPHVPEEVIRRIEHASKEAKADVTLIEVGGTVGEYQNVLFLEAARMMKAKNPDAVRFVLVSYLPVPPSIGEMKTKPTQYAVRTLNGAGIQPDFIIGRSTMPIDKPRKEKIAQFCAVPWEHIISAPDAKSVYHIPDMFEDQNFASLVLKSFKLKVKGNDLSALNEFTEKLETAKTPVKIGVIGKYFSTGDFTLSDAYISVLEAIKHAAWTVRRKPEIVWLNAEELEQHPAKTASLLKGLDGIIVPGGFGTRGIEGKMAAIRYAREHKVPYLGLCYGLQLATVEFARHVLGWKDANTTEIDPKTSHPVIHLMNEQEERMKNQDYGGTMRLGAYPCELKPGSMARTLYGAASVLERHRHRYECNPAYRCELEDAGLMATGLSPDGKLVEIIELKGHPFFMASQFHPEYLSRPFRPHPMFLGFMKAASKK